MADESNDRLFWFAVRVRGRRWPFYLVHPDEMVTGPENYAEVHGLKNWNPECQRQVNINARYAASAQNRAAFHECEHIAADGLPHSNRTEESFVTGIEGPLFSMLTRHCGLRMPKRPKGSAELMRRSRGGS